MKLEVSVPELVEVFKEIQKQPEQIFEMIRLDVREIVGDYMTAMMNAELTHFLGREPYARSQGDVNHRNGSYDRAFTLKNLGEVEVKVPRDRKGKFTTQVIPRSKQYEEEISRDLSLMFLAGISTRSLSMISRRLIGRKISHTEISSANADLTEAVEKWRMRDLSKESIKYIFVDGVNFRMRMHGSRREFFKDLKSRGLNTQTVTLGIMDGLPGLETVFKEEFSRAKVQRCIVHVDRNVIAKVPKKLKKDVAADLRSIFYAPSREAALEHFDLFKEKWRKDLPSAVNCLERSIDSCLTFFDFPADEWISLRTTNIIERLNKEFKRRTKPMEIVAGENACYRLLAFISVKMELHWRSNPVGKVHNNLPFFKELAYKKFTHKN